MRKYELVVIVRPSVKEADKKKLIGTIKDLLKDFEITKEDDWGQKPLAYTIKKEVAGSYSLFQFEGEAGVPTDLEQRILRNDDIIRHLLLRTK